MLEDPVRGNSESMKREVKTEVRRKNVCRKSVGGVGGSVSQDRRKTVGEVNFVDLQTAEYKCEVTTYKLLSECRRMAE
jgi:hypothetical protein